MRCTACALHGVCVSQTLTIAFVPLLDCSLCAHVVTTWAFHQQTVMMLLLVDPQVCLRPRVYAGIAPGMLLPGLLPFVCLFRFYDYRSSD